MQEKVKRGKDTRSRIFDLFVVKYAEGRLVIGGNGRMRRDI